MPVTTAAAATVLAPTQSTLKSNVVPKPEQMFNVEPHTVPQNKPQQQQQPPKSFREVLNGDSKSSAAVNVIMIEDTKLNQQSSKSETPIMPPFPPPLYAQWSHSNPNEDYGAFFVTVE